LAKWKNTASCYHQKRYGSTAFKAAVLEEAKLNLIGCDDEVLHMNTKKNFISLKGYLMPLSRENQRGVTMANNVIRKAYGR